MQNACQNDLPNRHYDSAGSTNPIDATSESFLYALTATVDAKPHASHAVMCFVFCARLANRDRHFSKYT